MLISVINHANIADEEVNRVIRAVNRQIAEDFDPHWSMNATLRLDGTWRTKPSVNDVVKGDAVIYLWNQADVPGALGYHDRNNAGTPYGFVFTEISRLLGEPWSVTFSHEALEMIADPEVNLLVQGPHPKTGKEVYHWYEVCDAVQSETYPIDGVLVSNFVLPLYFTGEEEKGSRNDFLGKKHGPKKQTLRSYGINPGGYIGFYDPAKKNHDTYAADHRAEYRLEVKANLGRARRSLRKQMSHGRKTRRKR